MKNVISIYVTFLLSVGSISAGVAVGGEYLGFKLGEQTFEQVKTILEESGGIYDDTYGYRGYSVDLPSIKVVHYPRFSKYGLVKKAFLKFSPNKKLYNLNVTWGDAGETFQLIKDALDAKYGFMPITKNGFERIVFYTDGNVEIGLLRNEFGFGKNQTTLLSYTYTPQNAAVEDMMKMIDEDIRITNAEKATGDL